MERDVRKELYKKVCWITINMPFSRNDKARIHCNVAESLILNTRVDSSVFNG